MDETLEHIKRFSFRLRLFDGWNLFQRTLWAAFGAAFAVQLTGRFLPVKLLWVWTTLPILLWLLGVSLWSGLKPFTALQAARRVDLELGLKERLSTSLALGSRQHGQESVTSFFIPSLIGKLHQDALETARRVDIRQAYPIRLQHKPLLVSGILLIALIGMAFLPNPMDKVLADELEIIGSHGMQAYKYPDMLEMIKNGRLQPDKLIEKTISLQEATTALPGMNSFDNKGVLVINSF